MESSNNAPAKKDCLNTCNLIILTLRWKLKFITFMEKNVALCGVSCSNNFFNNRVFLAMLASMLWKLWNWRFFINRMFSPPKYTIHFCRTALLLFRCLLLCILSTYKYLEELKNAMIRYLIIRNFCLLPFMHWQIL